MSFNKEIELKQKYDELLDLVYDVNNDENILNFKKSYGCDDLNLIVTKFSKAIDGDSKLLKYLVKRDDKLFRSGNNIKIIPDVNLKNILNDSIWECIQLLYAIYRTGENKYKGNIEKLISSIEKFNLGGGDIIEGSGNKKETKADDLIMEISNTLRDTMSNSSKSKQKINPIENMIKTSQIISDKYGNDIKSGNISIQDMFNSLGRLMGDIDKQTKDDENFKNIDIGDIPKPEEMMKDISDKFGLNINMDKFNPMEMLGSLMGNKMDNAKDLSDEQIKEMEEFYKKLSTEDMEKINNLSDNQGENLNK